MYISNSTRSSCNISMDDLSDPKPEGHTSESTHIRQITILMSQLMCNIGLRFPLYSQLKAAPASNL